MKRSSLLLGAGLFALLLVSGCVFGGSSTSLGQELQQLRKAQVPDGLLVPPSLAARESYQNNVLAYRGKTSNDTALNAYITGTLDLIAMQNENDAAVTLLKGVNPELIECGPSTNEGKAITHLLNAHEKATQAQQAFTIVQDNVTVANALGADYVVNARKTSAAIVSANEARVNDLKSACGEISV